MDRMKFVLELTEEEALQLEAPLNIMGVEFDPHAQLASINEYAEYHDVVQATSLRFVAGQVNEFLKSTRENPLLPEEIDGLSLDEKHQMMVLARTGFAWQEAQVEAALWRIRGKTWQQELEEFPKLLAAIQRNGVPSAR